MKNKILIIILLLLFLSSCKTKEGDLSSSDYPEDIDKNVGNAFSDEDNQSLIDTYTIDVDDDSYYEIDLNDFIVYDHEYLIEALDLDIYYYDEENINKLLKDGISYYDLMSVSNDSDAYINISITSFPSLSNNKELLKMFDEKHLEELEDSYYNRGYNDVKTNVNEFELQDNKLISIDLSYTKEDYNVYDKCVYIISKDLKLYSIDLISLKENKTEGLLSLITYHEK